MFYHNNNNTCVSLAVFALGMGLLILNNSSFICAESVFACPQKKKKKKKNTKETKKESINASKCNFKLII